MIDHITYLCLAVDFLYIITIYYIVYQFCEILFYLEKCPKCLLIYWLSSHDVHEVLNQLQVILCSSPELLSFNLHPDVNFSFNVLLAMPVIFIRKMTSRRVLVCKLKKWFLTSATGMKLMICDDQKNLVLLCLHFTFVFHLLYPLYSTIYLCGNKIQHKDKRTCGELSHDFL